jgi:hypothetical protein
LSLGVSQPAMYRLVAALKSVRLVSPPSPSREGRFVDSVGCRILYMKREICSTCKHHRLLVLPQPQTAPGWYRQPFLYLGRRIGGCGDGTVVVVVVAVVVVVVVVVVG